MEFALRAPTNDIRFRYWGRKTRRDLGGFWRALIWRLLGLKESDIATQRLKLGLERRFPGGEAAGNLAIEEILQFAPRPGTFDRRFRGLNLVQKTGVQMGCRRSKNFINGRHRDIQLNACVS